jgi:hypothetical protein
MTKPQLTPSRQNEYANAQAFRDQGISDACNGYPAFCWFGEGDGGPGSDVFCSGRNGVPERVAAAGIGGVCCPEYREAFAYARAYAAELTV